MASECVIRVLNLLEKVTVNSNGWASLCPAHADRVRSLSIAEGDGGRVLLYCHAGCSFEQVVAALGLNARDLFPHRGGAR
jgi:putative DNA primase/helicase